MSADPALRRAFRGATYGTAGQRLHLNDERGEPNSLPPFTRQSWAILTAWNPHGVPQPQDKNEAAQARLRAGLRGYALIAGINGEGEWAEASLIAPGLGLRRALKLGQQYGQVAVLWGTGARAALVWCQPVRVERFWLLAASPELAFHLRPPSE